jgi:hypothetical protein
VASLQTRVINILRSPAAEWPVIAREPSDVGRLYTSYICPLSAIPAVAHFIGLAFVGITLPLAGLYRYSMMRAFGWMVVSYLLGLAGAYICAVVIEWLAPRFKSTGTRADALKLVAYSSTPIWLAGIVNILPVLGLLVLIATIYGIYLFYLGLPHVMKTPADQVVIFMIVAAVVMIVISAVFGALTAAMMLGSV